MKSTTTIDICKLIAKAGGEAWLVGGCVRNAVHDTVGSASDEFLEDSDYKDIDIEVFGLQPDKLIDTLSKFGNVNVVGVAFGVIKFKPYKRFDIEDKNIEYDIALPRRERKKVDGKGYRGFHIEVDPTMTFKEACERRDFTMNAVMYNPITNEVIDFFDGRSDIAKGIIRHVSDRFSEDSCRVLRAMQFAARFGYKIDKETTELCRSLFDDYENIHTNPDTGNQTLDRIWTEWKKLALADYPESGLDFLDKCGWINHYPELIALKECKQDTEWHPEGNVWIHTMMVAREAARVATERNMTEDERLVLVLAAICHDLGKPETTKEVETKGVVRIRALGHCQAGVPHTETFLNSIGASKKVISEVIPLVEAHLHHAGIQKVNKRNVRRLANRLAPSTVEIWDALVEADISGRDPLPNKKLDSAWIDIAREVDVSNGVTKPVLNGSDLIERGLKPSKRFGVVLDEAYELQIEHSLETKQEVIDSLISNQKLTQEELGVVQRATPKP